MTKCQGHAVRRPAHRCRRSDAQLHQARHYYESLLIAWYLELASPASSWERLCALDQQIRQLEAAFAEEGVTL